MKPKQTAALISLIAMISLLSVGCSGRQNTQNSVAVAESPTSAKDNSQNNNNNSTDENGQVAGSQTQVLPTKNITVNNIPLIVEVADNDAAREQGLSDRENLANGYGMLFDFTNTDFHRPGFWMKDMIFSIDMIWINNDKVIGVEANVPLPPEDDLPVYYPPSDITHVLEVPAGWSAQNHVTTGSTVKL